MIVARHEVPGRCKRRKPRAVGTVSRIIPGVGMVGQRKPFGKSQIGKINQAVPSGTGSFCSRAPGTSCLATIIQSLRDAALCAFHLSWFLLLSLITLYRSTIYMD
jgi:hypothetical protein